MATLTFDSERVPLCYDEGDVIRVGNSRVSLDSVIREFRNGASPDDICRAYDTLQLADVYATILFYLRHQKDVDAYLEERRELAKKLRDEIEASQADRAGLREKLLARKALMEQEQHASPRG
jgi:uncharacterized protein (DUF433 family)